MLIIVIGQNVYSQEHKIEKKEPPSFSMFRAEEDYLYLADKEKNPYKKKLM